MERPTKRQKTQTALQDLPQDLLQIVASYLQPHDMVNLSMVSHSMRHRLLPIIFSKAQATWMQIMSLHEKNEVCFFNKHHVRSLRITDAVSFNEYKQNTFGQLLSPEVFPNLIEVSVNLINLSYWLRYNKCTHVRALTLYSNNVFRGVKIFELSHVDNFASLRLLCLHNYHFNWDNSDSRPKIGLNNLSLHDCTWEYPFDLALFNPDDTLRHLTITYSNNNSFMLLERFISFLKDPFVDHSESLRTVAIEFVDITENKKLLTPTILHTFLTAFSGIERLYLAGWTANINYLRGVLANHTFNFPVLLTLNVESLDDFDVSHLKVTNLKFHVRSTGPGSKRDH